MSLNPPAEREADSGRVVPTMARRVGRLMAMLLTCATVALAGCLDINALSDLVFAPTVPGLRSDQPWVNMPVGAWVVEGGIHAKAVAGCFKPECTPAAAVGLFEATGPDAADLRRLAADPEPLLRSLSAASVDKRAKPARKGPPAVSRVERLPGGFLLRMSRPDGSRAAYGVVSTRSEGASTTVILVISASEEGARQIAAAVTAAIS